jgi:Fe-S cluster assembly iron-binding protein IscA
MLTVTDRAKELIAQALDQNEAEDGQGLRIYLTDEGEFEMSVDAVQEDDQIVDQDGRPLVLVDPEVSWELDGATLDAEQGPEGLDLMLDLPEIEEGEDGLLAPDEPAHPNGAGLA